jgi:hypothetical protein
MLFVAGREWHFYHRVVTWSLNLGGDSSWVRVVIVQGDDKRGNRGSGKAYPIYKDRLRAITPK